MPITRSANRRWTFWSLVLLALAIVGGLLVRTVACPASTKVPVFPANPR